MVTHQCSRLSSGQSRGAPCTCPPCPEQPLAQYEEVAKQSHHPCNMQLAMSLLHDKIISLDKRKIQRCGKVNDGDGSVETVTCLWKQRPLLFCDATSTFCETHQLLPHMAGRRGGGSGTFCNRFYTTNSILHSIQRCVKI